MLPPSDQVVCGEVGGVVGGSHYYEAAVGAQVVDAVGNGDAVGLERKSWSLTACGVFRQPRPGFLKLPTNCRFLVSMLTIGRSHWANLVRCSEIWLLGQINRNRERLFMDVVRMIAYRAETRMMAPVISAQGKKPNAADCCARC